MKNLRERNTKTLLKISTLVFVWLLLYQNNSIPAGVRTSPPILFYGSTQKSEHFSVVNPSDNPIEVWLDFKYGYTVMNDSGKAEVITPDSLKEDDRSCAAWLRAYPPRFTLAPQEAQIVRIVATPPPGTAAGEYWSRILISSKDQQRPTMTGKGVQSTLGMISTTSVPLHYEYQAVGTGLRLKKQIECVKKDTNLVVTLSLQRTGNASYWGQINCELYNTSGKKVFGEFYRLVVYKDIDYTIRINQKALPVGDYTMKLVVKTERADVESTKLTKSDPITWTLPVKIQ